MPPNRGNATVRRRGQFGSAVSTPPATNKLHNLPQNAALRARRLRPLPRIAAQARQRAAGEHVRRGTAVAPGRRGAAAPSAQRVSQQRPQRPWKARGGGVRGLPWHARFSGTRLPGASASPSRPCAATRDGRTGRRRPCRPAASQKACRRPYAWVRPCLRPFLSPCEHPRPCRRPCRFPCAQGRPCSRPCAGWRSRTPCRGGPWRAGRPRGARGIRGRGPPGPCGRPSSGPPARGGGSSDRGTG